MINNSTSIPRQNNGPVAVSPAVSEEFDTGEKSLISTAYRLVARIGADGRPVLICGEVGAAGALTALLIKRVMTRGGRAVDFLENPTGGETYAIPDATPATPHSTSAGGAFQFPIMAHAAAWEIWAKGNATTLRISGSLL